MKRIPAVILFAILLANAAGFYVYYILELQHIHREMRAMLTTLPDEKLTRLVLPIQEYESSLVEDDEIKYKGRMFDVARMQHVSDSVIVFGVFDEKEDNLLALANEILNKPFDQHSPVTQSVVHFICLDFLPTQHLPDTSYDGKVISHASSYFFSTFTFSLHHKVPPPRVMLEI